MADPDFLPALDRIDRALHRIADAEARLRGRTEAHAALAARHARLRGRVEETVDRLDALIAEGAEPRGA